MARKQGYIQHDDPLDFGGRWRKCALVVEGESPLKHRESIGKKEPFVTEGILI